jgi:2-oxoglutarate ferredoxin oxidoreductase subunit alpha
MDPKTNGAVAEAPLESVVIRFCGDSGDGMQLAGDQFTNTSALFGNDIATFPDFPAEIRAPRGTTYGVSAFQLQFSSHDIFTPGDTINAMVAMNPAGFKVNIDSVEPGGIVIVNSDEFEKGSLEKCGYKPGYNPLEDESVIHKYKVFQVPMSRLTRESLADSTMGAKDVDRCRNIFALGVAYWLYERPLDATIKYLNDYYGLKKKRPEIAEANIKALKAGYFFGETAELFPSRYTIAPAKLEPGTYRRISGNEATALGLVTAANKAGKQLFYGSYPITPASDILHTLARLEHMNVLTFQAEDEIAAISAAIGAAFAGDIAATGTSGPGLALKSEAMGLAVIYELPLIVVDVQRAGPSTGMPTKTEQADLLQAMFGRHGECPCIILAASSPADCFGRAIEAVRLAVRHMCPVIFLSDGSVANGAEPWKLPKIGDIPEIKIEHPVHAGLAGEQFLPYLRDPKTLARRWAIPGTKGLEHRLGGLEKQLNTGAVSYDPDNHHEMIRLRAEKVARAADVIPPLTVRGEPTGDTLILGWGGTYGTITSAGDKLRSMGRSVSTAHLHHLNPFPSNLGEVLRSFKRVILPEINRGQLRMLIRAEFLVDVIGLNDVNGRGFFIDDLTQRVCAIMDH